MSVKDIVPVVLVGGTGTRLWPLSRSNYPKQFSYFGEKHSFFQKTILRANKLDPKTIYIVVGQKNYFLCVDQLAEIQVNNVKILVEPEGRNTAPAIAVAAHAMVKAGHDLNSVMLVLSADHAIDSPQGFVDSIKSSLELSEKSLILFGVSPDKPETGYGYIKPSSSMLPAKIQKFCEKPCQEKAKEFFNCGEYLWNSGIFMFSIKLLLSELASYASEIDVLARTVVEKAELKAETLTLPQEFLSMPNISIDYALLEKTRSAYVANLDSSWSDLGTWSSMYDISPKSNDENVEKGSVVAVETKNSYLHSDDRLLACVGLEDMVVVAAKDAVMVARKDQSQKVKDLIATLNISGYGDRVESNFKVFRPWGSYETLIMQQGFQVKHIIVNPGGKLSLQLHYKRSEHWIVVEGVADVVCGESAFQLYENQSTYISVGTKHRLANLQEEPLHLIEVQVGSYLGEDDIVRFDDVYGRVEQNV